VREARPDDHAAVLKVWPERRRDLASSRTQVVCRLHAVLCELVPGGVAKKIIAAHAARLLESITPPDAVASARCELAAAIIGEVRDVSRFNSRDHFASCNGTAPIEVSSGGRKVHRLSRRGNRRINHAIRMAAITQIRQPHSDGRAYYDKKLAEGKTHREALRALKRQISDAVFARLRADARRTADQVRDTGGQ
jgi:transposase